MTTVHQVLWTEWRQGTFQPELIYAGDLFIASFQSPALAEEAVVAHNQVLKKQSA